MPLAHPVRPTCAPPAPHRLPWREAFAQSTQARTSSPARPQARALTCTHNDAANRRGGGTECVVQRRGMRCRARVGTWGAFCWLHASSRTAARFLRSNAMPRRRAVACGVTEWEGAEVGCGWLVVAQPSNVVWYHRDRSEREAAEVCLEVGNRHELCVVSRVRDVRHFGCSPPRIYMRSSRSGT